MKWEKLSDGRTYLPEGTVLLLEGSGGWYRITGAPIGFGGSSIIYPAVRVQRDEEGWIDEEMNFAVKECYPAVPGKVLKREDTGRILGADDTIYHFALDQMQKEKTVTGIIYNAGFRLVPVWISSEREQIALDGEHFEKADNFYAVMERLDEKGRSLEDLACSEKMTAKDIFSLGCQLLRALKEVHDSGYIHGDIQTNNIFIKGFEAGDDLGVLSLLDFGAARKLEADNRTAPIKDRALYTTRGFSAPECLTQNDGTLRLSPAADLYSAGCVLLRMLSGRHISQQALELVTNGRYIYARQAAKLRCPASAAEAINRFLEKALRKEPENRYQSAKEMLQDAVRIEQSLAPANIAISTSEYAAFISYCHSEITTYAAQQLAGSIEHFTIPGYADGIVRNNRKKRQKIGKVFLDNMELSGGGDMGEQIVHALENSAYLIVILGGGSERSEWVAREIETFLKTHTRDRILTVLAEGNEKESMPEILKTQEFFTEEGKKIRPIESLSADLRTDSAKDFKRALKTEKLRLIAPMLGCSFDDLKQREKETRTRRLIRSLSTGMTLFAVIALIIGYQGYQIKVRNTQLLKIHAQELAEKSGQYLKEGDREQALSLALEALTGTSDNSDVPICAEAKAALQNALYLYRDSNNLTMAKKATRMMQMGRKAAPGLEALSPDGLRMLTRGADGSVFVWDLLTGKCIAGPDEDNNNELSRGVLFAGFLNDNQLLVIKDHMALRYPISVSDEKDMAGFEIIASDTELSWMDTWPNDAALLGTFNRDRSRIALCSCSPVGITEDGVRQVIPELIVCDTDTMRLTASISASEAPESSGFGMANSLTASGPVFSQDGKWAALPLTDLFKGDDPNSDKPAGALLLVDPAGSESRIITDPEYGFMCCRFTETDSLIAYGYVPVLMWELQEMPVSGAVSCIDIATGTKQWTTGIENQTKLGTDTLGILLQNDRAVLWGNRQIQVLDRSDGELLRTMQVRNGIAGVCEIDDYIAAGDHYGNLIIIDTAKSVVSEVGTSIDRSVDHFWYTLSIENGGMIVSDSAQGSYILLESCANTADRIVSTDSVIRKYYASMDSAYILIERQAGTFAALDLRTGEWAGSYPSDASYRFAGPEQVFTYEKRDDGSQILQLLNLTSDTILLQKEFDSDIRLLFSGSACGWQTDMQFHLLDVNGEIVIELSEEITEKNGLTITNMMVSDNKKYVYLFRGPERELSGLYDLEQNKWLPLPSRIKAENKGDIAISPDGSAVAWFNRETAMVCIFNTGETEAQTKIQMLSTKNFHMVFRPDNREVYCIADNDFLRSFDTRTGRQKAQSRELYTHISGLSVDTESGTILLDATAEEDDHVQGIYGTGDMHVLWLYEETPEETLCRMAGADNAFYSAAAHRMISTDYSGGKIFLYDYGQNQLNDLILKAKEFLAE